MQAANFLLSFIGEGMCTILIALLIALSLSLSLSYFLHCCNAFYVLVYYIITRSLPNSPQFGSIGVATSVPATREPC